MFLYGPSISKPQSPILIIKAPTVDWGRLNDDASGKSMAPGMRGMNKRVTKNGNEYLEWILKSSIRVQEAAVGKRGLRILGSSRF